MISIHFQIETNNHQNKLQMGYIMLRIVESKHEM